MTVSPQLLARATHRPVSRRTAGEIFDLNSNADVAWPKRFFETPGDAYTFVRSSDPRRSRRR